MALNIAALPGPPVAKATPPPGCTDQIIRVIDRGTELTPQQSLAVLDRDCQEVVTLPLPADTNITGIVPDPGATLVIRNDANGTHIDGYSPH